MCSDGTHADQLEMNGCCDTCGQWAADMTYRPEGWAQDWSADPFAGIPQPDNTPF